MSIAIACEHATEHGHFVKAKQKKKNCFTCCWTKGHIIWSEMETNSQENGTNQFCWLTLRGGEKGIETQRNVSVPIALHIMLGYQDGIYNLIYYFF